MSKKSTLSKNPLKVTLSALLALLAVGELHLSISKGDDKMGDIPFLSLPAGEHEIIRSDGEVLRDFGGTCKGCSGQCEPYCYAKRTEIQYEACRYNYAKNYVLAKYAPELFEKEFCEWLNKSNIRYFRIHEAGEFFSYEYLEMICKICAKFPDIHFYAYTRRYKWLRTAQDAGIIPANFKINVSARRENAAALKKYLPEFNLFIWDGSNLKTSNYGPLEIHHCDAVLFSGHSSGITCIECKRCITGHCDTAVFDHSSKSKKRVKHNI